MKYNDKQRILVEGPSDLYAISALWKRHLAPDILPPEITICHGYTQIPDILDTVLKSSISTIAIVVDADNDATAKFQKYLQCFQKNNIDINLHTQDIKNGIFKEINGKKYGIWIMPDNTNSGMLETFHKTMIPDNDELSLEVSSVLSNIEKKRIHKYSKAHKDKAFMATWLAWQENPGIALGEAITQRILDTDGTLAQKFLQWLKSLCLPDNTHLQ